MGGLAIMDIEILSKAIQCSILGKFIKEKKIKTKHGLISCCGIWINTGKSNKELASLRHT